MKLAVMAMAFTLGVTGVTIEVRAEGPIEIGTTATIRSEVLGEERALQIFVPPMYADSADPYPVIYLLDGPRHFHHVTGALTVLARGGMIPPAIVVGIGNTDRLRDMTPSADHSRGPTTSGGADAFLSFLRDELVPHVKATYRTSGYSAIVGHSMAGLFVVHALTASPDTFDAYIALSPNLQWDDELAQENAETMFTKRDRLDRSIYLAIGGDEGGRDLDAFDLFVSMLKSKAPEGFRWSHEFLAGDDHGTMVLRGTYGGLKSAFDGYRVPPEVIDQMDVAALKKHYEHCVKRFGSPPHVNEQLMNNLGYALLGEDKFDEAIELFQMNVRAHPDSANVYDSLGEAYERTGKLVLARENYTKAVERARRTSDANLTLFETNLDRVTKLLRRDT